MCITSGAQQMAEASSTGLKKYWWLQTDHHQTDGYSSQNDCYFFMFRHIIMPVSAKSSNSPINFVRSWKDILR